MAEDDDTPQAREAVAVRPREAADAGDVTGGRGADRGGVRDDDDGGKGSAALPPRDDAQGDNVSEKDDDTPASTEKREARNSKQKKNSKWKQMNKRKKEKKRQKIEQLGALDKKDKRHRTNKWKAGAEDREPEPPHEGSFAHEKMQALFDVKVDVPSGGAPGRGAAKDGNDAADATGVAATSGGGEGEEDAIGGGAGAGGVRLPKRKLAVLVSFLGTDYVGFQINHEKRTLQAELELALYRAGIISPSNFGHPKKYGWSNSARTDKGVHAAAQCCSLKGEMVFHHELGEEKMREQLDAMRERVNEFLPEDVRILDFEKVTRMFCARTNRDKVRYQYMVPSYLLCSREEVLCAFPAVTENKESTDGTDVTPSKVIEDTLDPNTLAQARSALIGYRATSEQMQRLRSGLKLFEGTHSFHNYTRRIGADDASATRYILSFAPLAPVIVPGGGEGDAPAGEWIPLQVVGQSFLLNQIRKMVSAAVDFARGAVSEETFRESLTKQCRLKVDVAPAQGLFLDRSFFELYNQHKVKNAPKNGGASDRATLDWVEREGEDVPAAVRRIEAFKHEKIVPHIVREEAREGNFLKYVHAHSVRYHDELYRPREERPSQD